MTPRGVGGPETVSATAGAPSKGNERQLEEHRRAWEREMERAQLAAWLSHDPLKSKAATEPLGPTGSPVSGASSLSARSDSQVVNEEPPIQTEPVESTDPGAGTPTRGKAHERPLPATASAQAILRSFNTRDSAPAVQPHPPVDSQEQTRRLVTALKVFGYVQASTSQDGTAEVPVNDPTDSAHGPDAGQASAAAQAHAGPVLAALAQRLLGAEYVPSNTVTAPAPATTTAPGALGLSSPTSAAPAPTVPSPPAAIVPTPAAPALAIEAVQATTSVQVGSATATQTAVAAPSGTRTNVANDLSKTTAAPQTARAADRLSTQGVAPAIRVHADWSAEGVRLWLGLDATVIDQMGAIAEQVRQWMRGQGVRMLSLACNGRLLDVDAGTDSADSDAVTANIPAFDSKEKQPWPSVQ
jgi:hypothetical protein